MSHLASLAFAFLLLLASSARAATEEERAQVFVAPFQYELRGRVAEAEAEALWVDREGAPRVRILLIPGRSLVRVNAKSVPTSSLRAGMRVLIRFQIVGGEAIATEIFADPRGAAPAGDTGEQGEAPAGG